MDSEGRVLAKQQPKEGAHGELIETEMASLLYRLPRGLRPYVAPGRIASETVGVCLGLESCSRLETDVFLFNSARCRTCIKSSLSASVEFNPGSLCILTCVFNLQPGNLDRVLHSSQGNAERQ